MQRKKSARRYAINSITVNGGEVRIHTNRVIHLNGTDEANEKAIRKQLNVGEYFEDLGMIEKLLYIPTEFFDELAVEIGEENTERERLGMWKHEAIDRLKRVIAMLEARKPTNEEPTNE